MSCTHDQGRREAGLPSGSQRCQRLLTPPQIQSMSGFKYPFFIVISSDHPRGCPQSLCKVHCLNLFCPLWRGGGIEAGASTSCWSTRGASLQKAGSGGTARAGEAAQNRLMGVSARTQGSVRQTNVIPPISHSTGVCAVVCFFVHCRAMGALADTGRRSAALTFFEMVLIHVLT